MTEFNELFYKDAYCKEFDSIVSSCLETDKGFAVILNDTAFYPEGGGQPSDKGTLNNIEVIDVQRINGEVVHYVNSPISVGTKVHGLIDWQYRFDLMQNHSGEHILSGIIHKLFGYENVGYRMKDDVIEIDISGSLSSKDISIVEQEVNEIIYKNVEIKELYPTNEDLKNIEYRSKKELDGQVRLIIIPGADVCACCGTHVKRTGEIGIVKIISSIGHKGGTRLELLCGKRAYEYFDMIQNQNKEIMHLLSLQANQIANGVKKIQDDNLKLNNKYNELIQNNLYQKASLMREGQKLIIDFEENLEHQTLVRFANYILNERKASTVVIINQKNELFNYMILSNIINLKEKVKEINSSLNGKGGGKQDMIQGSFNSSKEEIEPVLEKILNNF